MSLSSRPLVLVVDDDPRILRLVTANLQAQGYPVAPARDGPEALERAALQPPNLVVLDLALPKLDGLEVLRQLREWCQAPVVVLSAYSEEPRKVQALDLGADDYVTKPFGMAELLARVRAALRRAASEGGAGPAVEVGPLWLDQARRQVLVEGREVHLSRTEYELLRYLAVHADQVLTHHQLLQQVWGPDYGDALGSLRTFIKQLRKKLEPDPAHPRYLLTMPGVGYRLVGE
ncbi:MAG: response regulator transcription factor [Chloroflexi bacterium]|nr:response regulator transcription factor [Chloroflexota bacterium]